MARYLVTGGCGFIGSHLSAALVSKGHDVLILDDLSSGRRENAPPGTQVVVGDVRDAALVADLLGRTDGCFHLAAVASVPKCQEAPIATHSVNQSACMIVMDAAAAKGVPVVYASSAAVYGQGAPGRLSEAAPTLPLSTYGVDKLATEHHARVASLSRGVPTVGLRFFNVYGPGQDPTSAYSGVISVFCARLAAGQPVMVFGDGKQVRDFIYVGDVVRFLMAAMEHAAPRPLVFNICTGQPTSVLELIDTIAGVLRVAPQLRHAPARDGDIRCSVGDGLAAMRYFGIAPETSLVEGLRRVVAGR